MSFLSWNCRGLGNPATIHVLMDLVHSRKLDVIFLMETLCNKSKLDLVKNQLGFSGLFVVNCLGQSGGLALLWKNTIELDIKGYSRNHIDSEVCTDGGGGGKWRFTGYYGFSERHIRREAWQFMCGLAEQSDLPWVLMGDFNDILSEGDKRGRHSHPGWMLRGFREVVESCGLRNFEFSGHQFTWEKLSGT